mmetsp:Transcript_10007/g.33357  ORF Transcript_10007/g.33357 Transcript_10007/m.33357 type:complete len:490 (-) Transcript_10007:59-1528(-)
MRRWFTGKGAKPPEQDSTLSQGRQSISSDADLESGDLTHTLQEEQGTKSKTKKSVLSSTWRKLRRRSPKDKAGQSSPAKETPKEGAGGAGRRSKSTSKKKNRKEEAEPSQVSPELLQMVKYLGIQEHEKEFFWVAEEALRATLPEGWEEYKTEEGATYYFSSISGQSSWEHPLDDYFRFVYRKMRKMKGTDHQRHQYPEENFERDREMVDLLWAMELQQRNSEGHADSASSSHQDSLSTFSDHSTSQDDPLSGSVSEGSSGSLYGSHGSRSGSSGSVTALETVPQQVKDVATYLGINLEALSSPVTKEEVLEMAQYLGIDVCREGYLLPLAKMALQAPLPKGWDICKDEGGEPFYFHRRTGVTTYRHPADDYFMKKVMESRSRHVRSAQEGAAVRVSEPWLDFVDENGRIYWYNFRTEEHTWVEPKRINVMETQVKQKATLSMEGSQEEHRGGREVPSSQLPYAQSLRATLNRSMGLKEEEGKKKPGDV